MIPNLDCSISLQSARLRLVPVLGMHASAMFPVLSDYSLYAFTGGTPPKSVADTEHWFSALESRRSVNCDELWLTWIMFLLEDNAAIGYVQATIKNSQADIAWLVGSEWQAMGYASEATVTLTSWLLENDITNIRALIHREHFTSQSVAKAAGLNNSHILEDEEEVWLR